MLPKESQLKIDGEVVDTWREAIRIKKEMRV